MDEALQLTAKTEGTDKRLIFLCHNSLDKPLVRDIADALELETGTPYFLDVFAIPVGEEFMLWIERALKRSSGCAIFLGVNGWGPTHLWEAERALAQYRELPEYRLLPVALPGLRDDDARRLGDGKLFQHMNWADFRNGPRDSEALEKLLAAITGRELPQNRGPTRLTPYQVRRDAGRWREANTARERRSILYRGEQLDEAERIVAANPDYAVLAEVQPFISAAQQASRARLRRTMITIILVAVALLGVTTAAVAAYFLAETRRLESTSRELAIVADDAPRPDQQLLIGLAALDATVTPEARGAMASLLDRWTHLLRMEHVRSDVESLSAATGSGSIVAGTFDGHLVLIDQEGRRKPETRDPTPGSGAATAVLPIRDGTLVGRSDGAVDWVPAEGQPAERALPMLQAAPQKDRRVTALAGDVRATLVAAGGADASLRLFDANTRERLGSVDLSGSLRVNAIAFDPNAPRLAVGMAGHEVFLIDIFDPRQPRVAASFPTTLQGEPVALGFDSKGVLIMFTDGGWITRYTVSTGGFSIAGSVMVKTDFISAAAIDGEAGYVAVGDAGGYVAVYDLFGSELLERRRGHAAPVQALTFYRRGEELASGAGDGTVAIWTLKISEDLSVVHERPPGEVLALMAHKGSIRAVAGENAPTRVWGRTEARWHEIVDLDAATRLALGPDTLDAPVPVPDDEGFVPIVGPAIPAVALADGAMAWITRRGEVLWLPAGAPVGTPRVLTREGTADDGPPALGRDGRVVAWMNDDDATIGVFDADTSAPGPAVPVLPSQVRSIALDPKGRYLAAGLESGEVAIYVVGEANPRTVRVVHGSPVQGLIFSDDGGTLVSYGSGGGGADRSVAVASMPDLSDVTRLETRLPGGSASALAIGRRTDVLAVADHDGQVLLWSLLNRRFIGSLNAGGLWIPAIAIDDADQQLWVAGSDGRLLSYDLSREGMTQLACRKANRDLGIDEWRNVRPDDAQKGLCGAR